ncbi:MAG: DMT family transporter [Microcoleaceae cyanobacterium]
MSVNIQKQPENFTEQLFFFSALLFAICLLSFAAIFIRLSEQEISASATIFNRLWIATIFLIFWDRITSFISRSPSEFSAENKHKIRDYLGTLLLSAIVDLICILLWAFSLNQTSIGNSTLLHNLTPIFATLGGWLWLKQSFNNQFIVGVILATFGAGAIAFSDLQFGSQYLIGDSLALLSAIFYGFSYLIYEKLRVTFSTKTLLLITCFLRSLLMLPFVLLSDAPLFPSSWLGWLAVLGLGILCQSCANLILIHSLKQFSSGFISLFLLLDPIITAILAWIIFAEQLTFLNWIAFGFVLLGIYWAKSGQGAEKESDNFQNRDDAQQERYLNIILPDPIEKNL